MDLGFKILLAVLIAETICLCFFIYNMFGYKNLTVKLADSIKVMYCEHTSKNGARCNNLKYSSVPIDGKKGVMTQYCSIHLMGKIYNEEN